MLDRAVPGRLNSESIVVVSSTELLSTRPLGAANGFPDRVVELGTGVARPEFEEVAREVSVVLI